MDSVSPTIVIGLFLPVFAAFWLLVIKIISMFGWHQLAEAYGSDGSIPDDAKVFRMQSLSLRRNLPASYGNCIKAWIGARGLYLRPVWMFRPFHPMLHLKWNDIANVRQQGVLLGKSTCIELKRDPTKIRIFGRLGRAVLQQWESRN